MNFVIALTPKQYALGIIGFLVFCFGFVALDRLNTAMTPEEANYTSAARAVVYKYNDLNNDTSKRGAKNELAVVSQEFKTFTISHDWRLMGKGRLKIKNVTDVDVIGVSYALTLRSDTLGTNIIQVLPLKRWDASPLKPNEITEFDIRLNQLAMTSLRHEKGAPPAHVKDFVGKHEVSNIEINIGSFLLPGSTAKSISIGPDGNKVAVINTFKTGVGECWAYFETLVDAHTEDKPLTISKKNLETNRNCLDKINAASDTNFPTALKLGI